MSYHDDFTDSLKDGEPSIDLDNVFSHPAGLKVARYVVGACMKAAESALPPPGLDDTIHGVSSLTLDTSPEVAELLQAILSLSEKEENGIGSHDTTSDGLNPYGLDSLRSWPHGASGGRLEGSASSAYTAFSISQNTQSQNYQSQSHPPSIHSPSVQRLFQNNPSYHTQPDLLSRPSSTLSSCSGLSGSQTRGTDSPLRVQSPSVTPSNDFYQQARFTGSAKDRPDSSSQAVGGQHLTKLREEFSQALNQKRPFDMEALRNITMTPPSDPNNHQRQAYTARQATAPVNPLRQTQTTSNMNMSSSTTALGSNLHNSTVVSSFEPINKTSGIGSSSLSGGSFAEDQPSLNISRSSTTSSHTSHIHSYKPLSQAGDTSRSSASYDKSEDNMQLTRGSTSLKKSHKRKGSTAGLDIKKAKTDKGARKIVKLKEPKLKIESAGHKLGADLWMRILEFCPVSFVFKARFLNRQFKSWIDEYSSIFVNQRLEIYGPSMPPASAIRTEMDFSDPPAVREQNEDEDTDSEAVNAAALATQDLQVATNHITDRQYSNLLGGKGCLHVITPAREDGTDVCRDIEPGKKETDKTSRANWTLVTRICIECWKKLIIREDKIYKGPMAEELGRSVLQDLLAGTRTGMEDSYGKPHDFMSEEEIRERPRGAPRLYKVYLITDLNRMVDEYKARTLPAYVDDPNLSQAQNAAARAAHALDETAANKKRQDWVDIMKARNTSWMTIVKTIEGLIRIRRQTNAVPHDENRTARKALFTRRAQEDLPQIPLDILVKLKSYRAATRIYRDPGTERGWQQLKPKLEKEFTEFKAGAKSQLTGGDSAADEIDVEEDEVLDPVSQNTSSFATTYRSPRDIFYNVRTNPQPAPSRQAQGVTNWPRNSLSSFQSQYGLPGHQSDPLSLLAHAADNATSLGTSYGGQDYRGISYDGGASSMRTSQGLGSGSHFNGQRSYLSHLTDQHLTYRLSQDPIQSTMNSGLQFSSINLQVQLPAQNYLQQIRQHTSQRASVTPHHGLPNAQAQSRGLAINDLLSNEGSNGSGHPYRGTFQDQDRHTHM